MPLPTSLPNAPINGLRPIQADPPAANASAINALFAAYRDGVLTADDIADKLTQKPLRDQAENATNRDRLKQIEVAPRRREQELTQEDQRTRLNDLLLKQRSGELEDAPSRLSDERKLRELKLKEAEITVSNASDPTAGIQKKAEGEVISNFIASNPGVPLPRGKDGRVDMAAIGHVMKTQQDLQPVLGPDGKEVAGLAKDNTGKVHSIPRSAGPTEQQANAQMYSERMGYQRPILEKYETGEGKAQYDPTTKAQMPEVGSGNLLSTPLRVLTSDDHNTYTDAKKNWIAAVLRKESGAAISKSEETNANAQYFPQPGDSVEQVKAKQELRHIVEQKMGKLGEVPGVTTLSKASQEKDTSKEKKPTDDGIVSVTTAEEYEALADGTKYRDSKGNVAVKSGSGKPAAKKEATAPAKAVGEVPSSIGYASKEDAFKRRKALGALQLQSK